MDRFTQDGDGRVSVLQVTGTKERSAELRALVSAADSPSPWELSCYVREKLIAIVQQQYLPAQPRFRVEIRNTMTQGGSG